MKKNIILFTILVIILALFFYGKQNTEKTEDKNIKIGAIFPLSGNVSEYGSTARDGALLAFEEQQKNKNHFNYELIIEDDQADYKRTATAINKLIYADKINAVSTIMSGTGNIVAPIATKNKIPHFNYADDNSIATKNEYSFNRNIKYSVFADSVVELFNFHKSKNVFFINFNNTAARSLMNIIKPKVEKEFNIVGNEWINNSDRDFKYIAEKIKTNNPDTVYLYVLEPALTLIGNELRKMGYKGNIVSSYTFAYAKNKNLFEGRYFLNAKNPNEKFKKAFKDRFGYEPNLGSAEAYDNINLIIETFEKTKSKSANKFIENTIKVIANHNSAFGKLKITEDKIIYSDLVLNKVENGKIIEVDE